MFSKKKRILIIISLIILGAICSFNLSLTKASQLQHKLDPYNYTNNYPNFIARELLGRPTNTSIVINLIAGDNNTNIYIEYGNESSSPNNYKNTTEILRNINKGALIEINLTNLSSNTKYYYRVRARKDGCSYKNYGEKTFWTRRNAHSPFNFSIFTDPHIVDPIPEEEPWASMRSEIFNDLLDDMTKEGDSDFALFLGDNIKVPTSSGNNGPFSNESSAIRTYTVFRNNVHPIRYTIPLFFVIGNWEGENGWFDNSSIEFGRSARKKYIPNPDNNTYKEGGNEHEDYFAFTWGNTLFVILNVQTYTLNNHTMGCENCSADDWTLGEKQLTWLNQTLNNSNQAWKFIFIHHTVGGNGSNQANSNYGRGGGRAAYVGEQAIVHQMMIENNVSVFFYGHDHLFVDIIVDNIHYTCTGRAGDLISHPFGGGYGNQTGTLLRSPGIGEENNSMYRTDLGRTKVEIESDDIMRVLYINQSEDIVANYTIDRTEI